MRFSTNRRIIQHGYCIKDDLNWRPHNLALNPIYSNYGLDWSSKLRSIQAYQDESRKDENLWPEHSSHLRTFSSEFIKFNVKWNKNFFSEIHDHGLSPEWLMYTNGYYTRKKCLFNGIHQRSVYCTSEYMLHYGFTHKRRSDIIEQQYDYLNTKRPGDKSYRCVEHSPDFYKIDSTVPKVQFGLITHMPKQIDVPRFPVSSNIQPTENELDEDLMVIRKEIQELDEWKPAPTLTETISSVKFSRK